MRHCAIGCERAEGVGEVELMLRHDVQQFQSQAGIIEPPPPQPPVPTSFGPETAIRPFPVPAPASFFDQDEVG